MASESSSRSSKSKRNLWSIPNQNASKYVEPPPRPPSPPPPPPAPTAAPPPAPTAAPPPAPTAAPPPTPAPTAPPSSPKQPPAPNKPKPKKQPPPKKPPEINTLIPASTTSSVASSIEASEGGSRLAGPIQYFGGLFRGTIPATKSIRPVVADPPPKPQVELRTEMDDLRQESQLKIVTHRREHSSKLDSFGRDNSSSSARNSYKNSSGGKMVYNKSQRPSETLSHEESEAMQALELQNYVSNKIELLKRTEVNSRKVSQLAAFVPDFILRDAGIKVPYVVTEESVVIMADVSGFTALTEAYSLRGKGGTDQLTKVLSNYIGPLAECILRADGDIIKYAGDAFLAIWRVEHMDNYPLEIQRVIDCALYIQEQYGSYLCADVNITIKVKIGIGAGVIHTSGIGNDVYQHWVCFGPGVESASDAEKHCSSTEVVIHQAAWIHCNPENYRIILKQRNFYQIREILHFINMQKRGRPRKRSISLGKSDKLVTDELTVRPILDTAVDRKSEVALRYFLLPLILKKLDDDIPLEYLNESRQVSICFIQVHVDTTKGADMGAVVQKAFIKIYQSATKMQGCLTKVIMFDKGLTYLVVFGLPGYINENQSAHALKFSYNIKRTLRNIRSVQDVSIGVTTGSCYCGVLGHPKRQEYTVIGRKVNKAARLMCNYPKTLTCDQDTMYHSKLPLHNFLLLEAKELKGISNVGKIYEFQDSEGGDDQPVQWFEYPMLGREPELKYFKDCIQKAKTEFSMHIKNMITSYDYSSSTKDTTAHGVCILIFEGENGIGKSRLLASCIQEAEKMEIRVYSITLNLLVTSQAHYGITSLMLQALKMEDRRTGAEREDHLRRLVTDPELSAGLCMLNEILHTKFPINPKYTTVDSKASNIYGQHILATLLTQVFPDELIIFVIDDSHLMDPLSWEYLLYLSRSPRILTLCSLRRNNSGSPKIENSVSQLIYHNKNVKVIRLAGLDTKLCLSLACQMMEVTAIPTDLESLLVTKSQGVPAWCDQVLKELLRTGFVYVIPFKDGPYHKNEMKTITNRGLLERLKDSSKRTELLFDWVSTGSEETSNRHSLVTKSITLVSSSSVLTMDTQRREEEKVNPLKRMLVVKSDTNIASVPVSGTLKEILLDAFDELNSNEQMVLKCASVLGLRFSRQMLIRILPVFELNSHKYEGGFRNLMEARYFRCASAKAIKKDNQTGPPECFCQPTETNTTEFIPGRNRGRIKRPAYWSCKFMEFVKDNMVEVVYELMTEDQRKELHLKAAKYLDSSTVRCPNCGGGNMSFLFGFSAKTFDIGTTEQAFRLAAARRRSSNRVLQTKSKFDMKKNREAMEQLSREVDESVLGQNKKRRASIITQIEGLKKTFQNNGTKIGQIELDILKAVLEFEDARRHQGKKFGQRLCCSSREKQKVEETEEMEDELDDEFKDDIVDDIDYTGEKAEEGSLKEEEKIRGQKDLSGGDVNIKSDPIHRRDSVDLRLCECSALQAKICVEMVKHYRFSEKYGKCLVNLLDAAESVITIGNGGQALVHLEDALGLLAAIKNKDLPAPDIEDYDDIQINEVEANGHIDFLSALAYFENGIYNKAKEFFIKALSRLGLILPVDDGKSKKFSSLFGLKAKLWGSRNCNGPCKTKKGNNVSNLRAQSWETEIRILSYLHVIYKSERKMDMALLVTLYQVITAEKYGHLMRDTVPAYCNMMEMYSALSKHTDAEKYETLALAAIRSTFGSAEQIEAVGLLTSANLFMTISTIRILRGCISTSIEAGYLAYRISQTIHDNSMTIRVLPQLIQSLLLALRITEVIEALRKLWYTTEEEEDWCGIALYYIMCLELLLNSAYTIEPFTACEQFVGTSDWLSEVNMYQEYEVQFAIEACMALWYARYSRWEASQLWINRAESHHPKATNFMSVGAELKLLEANLIFVNHYLESKNFQHFAQSRNAAKELMGQLHKSTNVVPALLPRFLHLLAYYYRIRSRNTEAEKNLKRADALASEHGNKLEIAWISHSRAVWAEMAIPTVKYFWLEHTETHTLDWHNFGDFPWANIMFSLPLPT